MIKKIVTIIAVYLCIILLLKIFFDYIIPPAPAPKVQKTEETFDPVKYDARFALIEDIAYRNAIFHYGKQLTYYVNDPYGFLITLSCVESSFGKHLHGKDGEKGLFQIHPYWKKYYNLEEVHLEQPDLNVYIAVDILVNLFKTYHDPFIVLNVYNTGSKNRKNQKYINRFLECYAKINF